MGSDAAKFTLRFRNRQTHELLGLVADQLGMSKNRLAEQMLERELDAAARLVERDSTALCAPTGARSAWPRTSPPSPRCCARTSESPLARRERVLIELAI